MAEILETGGGEQGISREQAELMRDLLGRLKDLGKGVVDFAFKVNDWAKGELETGNKLLLDETTTLEDVQQVETAIQEPQNSAVEVNAISQTKEGEIIRQPMADPWDQEIGQVVSQAMSKLDPIESEAISVDAVIDNPEPVQATTPGQKPLVNEFIGKAGETLQQQASQFMTEAERFIQENVQVTVEPIPQQDGSLALAVDKPSLLAQMSLAGGNFAQAAKDELKTLAPNQFDTVSQAVQNTQERVKQGIDGLAEQVQAKIDQPSVREEVSGLRADLQTIRHEISEEFKTEIGELRSQVGTLELQISNLQQQQSSMNDKIQALDAKPPLNNSKLNTWQQSFTNKVKATFQQASQKLGEKINQLKTQVQGLVEKFKQKVGQKLQPLVDRLQPAINKVENLKADVIDGYQNAQRNVSARVNDAMQFVGEKATDLQVAAINKSADYLFDKHGNSLEGTQVYAGDKFDFHRDPEGTLTITGRDQKTIYQKGEFNTQVPKEDREAIVGATKQISENLDKKESVQQKQATKKQPTVQNERPKALAAGRKR